MPDVDDLEMILENAERIQAAADYFRGLADRTGATDYAEIARHLRIADELLERRFRVLDTVLTAEVNAQVQDGTAEVK